MILDINAILKISYKEIKKETIDFVISDILNSNLNKYNDDFIKHIIKALCYYLVSNYYDDYDIEILPQKQIDKKAKQKDILGISAYKKIYLEETSLLNIKSGCIDIINTIMHEVHHVRQNYLLEHNKLNYTSYQIISEQVISSYMGINYRMDNYWYMFDEVEARYKAEIATYRYLRKVCPNKANEILNNSKRVIKNCCDEFKCNMRKTKYSVYTREEMLDRIIRRNPKYLEIYPLLNFYYNDDGSKISLGSILSRDVITTHEDKLLIDLQLLDQKMINNRHGTKKNIQKDLISLYEPKLLELCSTNPRLEKTRQEQIKKCEKLLIQDSNYDEILNLYDELQNKINETSEILKSKFRQIKLIPLELYLLSQELENPLLSYFNKRKQLRKK